MTLSVSFLLAVIQNALLTKFFGLSELCAFSKKPSGMLLHGVLSAVFCTAGSWLLYRLRMLFQFSGGALWIPLCVVFVTALLAGVMLAAANLLPDPIKQPARELIVRSAYSGAVLGILYLCTDAYSGDLAALSGGFRSGIGYFTACLMLWAAAPALCSGKMPERFRGERGLCIYAVLLSMAAACMTAG